jgi:endosialidase-like protein
MPRDGSHIYSIPPGTEGIPDTTIESARYNSYIGDVEQDLNLPRPIIAGGTGANNAADAMKALGGEFAQQLVTNYDSFPFQSGSFYSPPAQTGGPPVPGNSIVGTALRYDDNFITLIAYEVGDPSGKSYVRTKFNGVWGVWATVTSSNDKVSKAGDTMTGSLTINSTLSVTGTISVNSNFHSAANVFVAGIGQFGDNIQAGAASADIATIYWTNLGTRYIQYTAGQFRLAGGPFVTQGNAVVTGGGIIDTGGGSLACGAINAAGGGEVIRVPSGGIFAAGYIWTNDRGYQPGGGMWANTSDARIKTVVGEYENGLDQIISLQPKRYLYKGNDTREPPSGSVPYENSNHNTVATEGREFIGLIAQEVEAIMPEMVTQRECYIDGQQVTDLRELDTTPLIFALINAIKQLTARVEQLEGSAK